VASPDKTPLEAILNELCESALEAPLSHVDDLERDGVLDRYGESAAYKELRDGIRALEAVVVRLREALRFHHEVGPAPDTDGTPCPACGAVASPDKEIADADFYKRMKAQMERAIESRETVSDGVTPPVGSPGNPSWPVSHRE